DGTIQIIGKIAIANVPNPDALQHEGNSYYKAVNNTGVITYTTPGESNTGVLRSGGLEMSNVDLANEFSDMIMTQRGFQANSKMITVSDEMLETLVNLKR
ncbi:MAG: flagellar hook-basal body complex protein, partial [Faecalispora jeddahensis]